MSEIKQEYMEMALNEARIAGRKLEVPVGAVIVRDDKIIGRGHNLRETNQDPTTHAEMIAIREAAKNLGSWRLSGSQLYVTLEPCPMCAGAILQARIEQVVFGTFDPKAGAAGSLYNLLTDERFNHQVELVSGLKADESRQLLQDFFRQLRLGKDG
ncbi:MAG: tRNA adenosine(34) deaminase TadA [Bacillota bacterium]